MGATNSAQVQTCFIRITRLGGADTVLSTIWVILLTSVTGIGDPQAGLVYTSLDECMAAAKLGNQMARDRALLSGEPMAVAVLDDTKMYCLPIDVSKVRTKLCGVSNKGSTATLRP